MNALRSIFLPTMLAISLAGCVSGQTQTAPPVAAVKASASAAADRRAEIRAQIAKVCPVILRPSELDRAAALVDRLAADAEVVATVRRLFRFDGEARVCRGMV